MIVRDAVAEVALNKGLRRGTYYSYERLIGNVVSLDMDVSEISQAGVIQRLWEIESPNTRRSTVIALRSVFGWSIKIPRSIPKRYDLPDEDTLRFALMLSRREARGLLMMYAGLRIGEACAVTAADRSGDRLTVARQVVELHRVGEATTWTLGPTKTAEASVIVPEVLWPVIDGLDTWDKPGRVRESLRRAGKRAGLDLAPHMLRKWYCTHLIERGLPLELVRRQMRHSDISVTLSHYQQFRESDIHAVFKQA